MRIKINGLPIDTDAIKNIKNGVNNIKNRNINTNNLNTNKVTTSGNPILFFIVGIIFLGVAVFAFTNISKAMEEQKLIEETYEKVVAEVKEVEEEYDSLDEKTEYFVTVVYEVEGAEYSYKFKSDNYVRWGDEFNMYYDPAKPYISMLENEANKGNSMIFISIAFGIFGVFAMFAGIVAVKNNKKNKSIQTVEQINPSVMPNTNVAPNPSVMPNTGTNLNPSIMPNTYENNNNQNNIL